MELQVSKLKNNEGQMISIEEEATIEKIDFHGDALEVTEVLNVTGGAIYSPDDTINVSIDISTNLIQHCRRCLQPIERPINLHEEIEFRPAMETEMKSEGKLSIYRLREGTQTIDLLTYILRFVKLDLEPYPLCSKDCKGLCSRCGANLNEQPNHDCQAGETGEAKDPRMEKLAELL